MIDIDIGQSIKTLASAGLITVLATTAAAQDATGRSDGVPTCQSSAGASRTREACGEEEPTALLVEREFTFTAEFDPPESLQCETEISVEYYQRDTIARVNGRIENDSCAAATGQYEIAIRIQDENGEFKMLEFDESWKREDDQPVTFTAEYPIGENVELIRLRTQGLSCTCSDTIDE